MTMNPLLRRWSVFCCLAVFALYGLFTFHESEAWSGLYPGGAPYGGPGANTAKHFYWEDVPQRHPVTSMIPLPTGTPASIPKIQYNFKNETRERARELSKRRDAVKNTFIRSWNGYKKHAWLQDEVSPLTGEYSNNFAGWGATLVDTLDTLTIMGLDKEFAIAVAALRKIEFTSSTFLANLNVFETTIRYLGGLLSAHDLSHGRYPILFEKAKELGNMLYNAFDTPNRMPITRWNWEKGAASSPQEALPQALIAEIGSLSVEFTRLSQLTGDSKYYDAVQRVSDELERQQNETRLPGLWPVLVDTRKAIFTNDRTFTFGGMADSLYEYFPKQHLILGGLIDQYRNMYETAIETAKKRLFFKPMTPMNEDILISGTAKQSAAGIFSLQPEGQHLTCFVGGMVGLGAKVFDREGDLEIARKLVDGCIWAYEAMPTGIAPELFNVVACPKYDPDCSWDQDEYYKGVVVQSGNRRPLSKEAYAEVGKELIEERNLIPGFTNIDDRRYMLRPEAIESVFILYRITGDSILQDKAWQMFQAITTYTSTNLGNAAINDVTAQEPEMMDKCESFWMAETLKYFYLIFSDPDVVSLDEYVFNTEAHPLRRPEASMMESTTMASTTTVR